MPILVAIPEGELDVQLLDGLIDFGHELIVARKESEAVDSVAAVHNIGAVVIEAGLGAEAVTSILAALAADPQRLKIPVILLGSQLGQPRGVWSVLPGPVAVEDVVLMLNQVTPAPKPPAAAQVTAAHRRR